MSIFTDKGTLIIGLVKQHLDAEWFTDEGKAIPTSSRTFKEPLMANGSVWDIAVKNGGLVEDGYGNEEESVLYKVECVTDADAMSLKGDIEDWNEQQTEDCFCYTHELVSSLIANATSKRYPPYPH
jgi:hypothetical protein